MHLSLAVADYLLKKAGQDNLSLTPMQLIKLAYLCHGWMLGLYDRALIAENVEAWRYGPVIRNLYSAVKRFRADPVMGPLIQNSGAADDFSADEKSIMDQVFTIYGKYSGIDLSRLTHSPGSPWHKTWNAGEAIIPNALIKLHFQGLSKRL